MNTNNAYGNDVLGLDSPKKPIDRQHLVENGSKKYRTYGDIIDAPAGDKEKEKEEPKSNSVSIRQLFRFATKLDIFLLIIGSLCAAVNGAAWPGVLLIMADTVDSLVAYRSLTTLLEKASELMGNIPGYQVNSLGQQTNIVDNQGNVLGQQTNVVADPPIVLGQQGNVVVQNPNMIGLQGSMLAQQVLKMSFNLDDPTLNPLSREFIYSHIEEFVPLCPNITRFLNYTAVNCDIFEGQTDIFDDMKDQAVKYMYFGFAVLACAMAQVLIFIITSERQVIKMRKAFYKNIIRQDMSWFDAHSAGELTVKLTDDINHIHDALGDKVGTSVQWFSASVAGIAVSFYYGWELSLVMISAAPALAICFGVLAKTLGEMTKQERVAYAQAGTIAEEVFSSIRTVTAFGGQEKEAKRYKENLILAQDYGIKRGKFMGFSVGSAWSVIYFFLAIGFYYGGKLVRDGDYEIKDMMVVFLASLIGSFSIGLASPAFSLVKVGCGAAYEVYRIIDQPSKIDSMSKEGQKPVRVKGVIRFQNVHFSYPSRPDVKVLNGINLTVSPGQTVALVGQSGCGKSTITQLLMRFYDVNSGEVTLDGKNIKNLNVKHLRQCIGIVSQEPVLFPTTIEENIRYGREGVTKEEIIKAAKEANAYDFIMKMPQGFDCYVGERGAQLSGGQKQRIAIARSLIREPCVLLLDEATSALDRASEAIVQDALDKASQGRTTLVIAHRLSTIRNADVILVMEKGQVAEKGTHDSLMAQGGIYYGLVNTQSKKSYDSEDKDGMKDELESEKSQHLEDAGTNLGRTMSFTEEEVDEAELRVGKREAAKRIWQLTKPEWIYNFFGCFASLFNGAVQPVWGFLMAQCLIIFTKEDEDDEKKEMTKLSLVCTALGFVSLLSYTVQHYNFGVSGERLIGRIRSIAFKAMLRQEIGWFDVENHQSSVLCAQLAEKASLVKGAVQAICMSALISVGVLASALSIGFVFSWRLTLVAIAFIPLVVLSGVLTVKETKGLAEGNKTTLEDTSKEAMSAVANIRTVTSLTKEELFLENFSKNLDKCFKFNLKSTLMMATGLAVSCSSYYFTFSAIFYYGAVLLEDDTVDAVDVFRVFNCIILSSVQLGRMVGVAPDTKGALKAARQIFTLQDSVPAIDPYSKHGQTPATESVLSTVKFSNVHFRYPMRPDMKVLRGLDLQVDPGEMLALVGESGSGKSTVIQLLERFYRPSNGIVSMDQYQIEDLNVQWLRAQIGLVAQEPVLFDTSIAENIAYGDNTRTVSMDEIIEAAKSANIHNFIHSLPQGYETNVGNKGTQLSGGQKQRIAIARALVRNPKILLLDEATSALDTESEKIVQDALDKAREGRTCITIAHRLSTIKNADKIAVIRNGVVYEQGNHNELMNAKGLYYHLQTRV